VLEDEDDERIRRWEWCPPAGHASLTRGGGSLSCDPPTV
jgi:hypothetical protein